MFYNGEISTHLEDNMYPVYCRMCLKDPPADSLVFSIYDTLHGRTLVELIDELFSIKVTGEDRLLNVCLECVNRINSVQNIHHLFVANNDKLQNMLHAEEAEAIGFDNKTEIVNYDVMHIDGTPAEAQDRNLWKAERENSHRQTNGGGETKEDLLTIEEWNTQDIEELSLDSEVKCGIARQDLAVDDDSSTNDRADQPQQLAVLNRKCYFCSEIFSTSLEYTNHLTQHYNRVPYTCTECNGRVLQSVQRASKHIGMHDRTDRPYGCRVCALRFPTSNRCLIHERNVHRYKPKQQVDMQKQQLSNGRSPSSRSKSMSATLKSNPTHNKPRPFNCEICGNSFTLKRALNRHLMIHSGERPYKCTECDRTFRQSFNLVLHRRRFHPNTGSERLRSKKKNPKPSEKKRA